MISTETRVKISSIQKAILQTILYFDIFKYPLKSNEVLENCKGEISSLELEASLNELLTLGYLKQVKDFVMPHWADVGNVERRQLGNERAKEMMNAAYKQSAKISQFPFVRGLCISGSLSKNYADEHSDIDFFVITKADRLWICRSLFIVFYKLLPAGKKKLYCLNYFISEQDLRIDDKNLFVATELAHLIPMYGYKNYKKLLESNPWYKNWFTNKPEQIGENCQEYKSGIKKTFFESFFPGKLGNWFDDLLLKKTAKGWARRFSDKMDAKQFEMNYRSRRDVAKRHEKGYQDKVLSALAQKIKDIEDTFQQKLN
jgi:hypothetical protein